MQAESSTASAHQAQADAALPLFARGVISLLTIWPALRLALTHGWAPPPRSNNTSNEPEFPPETPLEKRTRMAEELVDAYYSSYTEKNGTKPEITEIEDFLLDFFEFEYGVALEDASEVTLAKDLEGCWSECLRRVSSGTQSVSSPTDEEGLLERLDRLAKKAQEDDKDPSKAFRGTRTGGQDDDEDDSETDEEDRHEHGHTHAHNSGMDLDEAPQLQPTPREKEEPIVDEEGFTTVVKKKGNRH